MQNNKLRTRIFIKNSLRLIAAIIMHGYVKILLFIFFVKNVLSYDDNDNNIDLNDIEDNNANVEPKHFIYWPNATIPFYINPSHFDNEQAISIMAELSSVAFKTCVKFVPVLTRPQVGQHVLVFENPGGTRKCDFDNQGHSRGDPHVVQLGYDCIAKPYILMFIMRALGFSFEHNRMSRDVFIEVMYENIEPSAIELFTKQNALPQELRAIPYDVNSVMHFGPRDYSKNGHRTIIFRDRRGPVVQNRLDLTNYDLRKIEIVYGPECRARDRQEKLELCQKYPSTYRKKREAEEAPNLRVNRDITPAPDDIKSSLNNSIQELGIEEEVQQVVEVIYKVTAKALQNARVKFCNVTKPALRAGTEQGEKASSPDIFGIIDTIANYAQAMVDNAVANLTIFCEDSKDFHAYQRSGCPFYAKGIDCPPKAFRSTRPGAVRYSTQHRPVLVQSTKHYGKDLVIQYHWRARENDTQAGDAAAAAAGDKETTRDGNARKKRHIDLDAVTKSGDANEDDGLIEPGVGEAGSNVHKDVLRSMTTIYPLKKSEDMRRHQKNLRQRFN